MKLTKRDIDKLIAIQVLGYQIYETDVCGGEDNYWLDIDSEVELPCYSTYLPDAVQLFEYLKEQGSQFGMRWNSYEWTVGIYGQLNTHEDIEFSSDSLPLAISIAILKYKGYTFGNEPIKV